MDPRPVERHPGIRLDLGSILRVTSLEIFLDHRSDLGIHSHVCLLQNAKFHLATSFHHHQVATQSEVYQNLIHSIGIRHMIIKSNTSKIAEYPVPRDPTRV